MYLIFCSLFGVTAHFRIEGSDKEKIMVVRKHLIEKI